MNCNNWWIFFLINIVTTLSLWRCFAVCSLRTLTIGYWKMWKVQRGSKTQRRSDEAKKGCGGGTCFYVLQPVLLCQCVPQPASASLCICASLCGSQCIYKSITLPRRIRQVEMTWPRSGWWKGKTCKGRTCTYLQNNYLYHFFSQTFKISAWIEALFCLHSG